MGSMWSSTIHGQLTVRHRRGCGRRRVCTAGRSGVDGKNVPGCPMRREARVDGGGNEHKGVWGETKPTTLAQHLLVAKGKDCTDISHHRRVRPIQALLARMLGTKTSIYGFVWAEPRLNLVGDTHYSPQWSTLASTRRSLPSRTQEEKGADVGERGEVDKNTAYWWAEGHRMGDFWSTIGAKRDRKCPRAH